MLFRQLTGDIPEPLIYVVWGCYISSTVTARTTRDLWSLHFLLRTVSAPHWHHSGCNFYVAAKALGLDKDYGTIEEGKKAHFIIWDDVKEAAELSYRFGHTPSHQLIYNGVPLRPNN